jgi:hypothetical protein
MLTLNEQRNLCLRYNYMIQQYPYSFKLFFFLSKIGPALYADRCDAGFPTFKSVHFK